MIWRLHNQLYGRRPATKAWGELMAKVLVDRCGRVRCQSAPNLFPDIGEGVADTILEVHMDDYHAAGS